MIKIKEKSTLKNQTKMNKNKMTIHLDQQILNKTTALLEKNQ